MCFLDQDILKNGKLIENSTDSNYFLSNSADVDIAECFFITFKFKVSLVVLATYVFPLLFQACYTRKLVTKELKVLQAGH